MKLRGMKLIFFLKEPLGSSIFLKVVAKSKTLVAKKKKLSQEFFLKMKKSFYSVSLKSYTLRNCEFLS